MAYISQIKTPNNTTHKILSNFYAVCNTAASAPQKVVSIDNFILQQGVTVVIKFTYGNAVNNPLLQVGTNSSDAKSICLYGSTPVTSNTNISWPAGAVVSLTYDGTSWIMNKGFNPIAKTYISETMPDDAVIDDPWFVIDNDIFNITYTLTNVTSSNTAKFMQANSNYTTKLLGDGTISNVSVTMNNTDITSTTYSSSTNTITINSITGDVTIIASID